MKQDTFSIHGTMTESKRMLSAVKTAKAMLHESYLSGSIWVRENGDIKYALHFSKGQMEFDTLFALESWVAKLSIGGDREILHRKFSL